MAILTNPWVVGIGGGVLSGLLVTLITRYLFSKRERREYLQKISTANNEIIYAIRPAIAEKIMPSSVMLDALFSATARKYSVEAKDLYSKASLANELIKEVMDNTFLSSQQKVDFCELLLTLKVSKKEEDSIQKVIEYVRVNRGSSSDTSAMLGVVTGTMAVSITAFLYMKDKEEFLAEGLSGITTKLIPMMAVMTVVPILSILLRDMLKRLKYRNPDMWNEARRVSSIKKYEANKTIHQPTDGAD